MPQITIIGLDTVGASLGLALRKTEQPASLVGVERDPLMVRRAQQAGAVERVERWAENACKNAGLVIVTEPMSRLHDILEAVAGSLPQGCVVTATAPLIAPVLAWADALLPESVSFVAGHPILDPTQANDVISSELFHQAQYCIVPSVKATSSAMDLVSQLAASVGARPFFLDAAEHDGLVTAVESLPGLLGMALMSAAADASSWRDMRRVAGASFARATSSAEADPQEAAVMWRANRDNVARWLETYCAKLGDVRAALLSDDESALVRLLTNAREARALWLKDHQSGNWEGAAPMPKVSIGTLLGQMVLPQRRAPEDKPKR
jgi:prephenate dehydrogenase